MPAGNRFLRSQEFDNAAWIKSSLTVTANTVTAPDGTLTADTLTDSADGAPTSHYAYQSVGVLPDTTVSLFARAGTLGFVAIYADSGTIQTTYNLTTGAFGSILNGAPRITDYGISPAGAGWYRVWVTYRAGVNTLTFIFMTNAAGALDYTGAGTGTIFVWGAQQNIGGVADYLVTVGATVAGPTRFRGYPIAVAQRALAGGRVLVT
jgi:hypothetical protein